jgi:LuxR family transcriptional regulator, maltose regulon positive regulatory protein
VEENSTILLTKITPPDVKEHILRRPSLMKKMKAVSNYPLTIIHSGPGYGKTTALSTVVKDQNLLFSWYSISTNDDDIIPFLSYITSAIRKQHPTFGTNFLFLLGTADRYIRDEEIRSLCSLFINEVISFSSKIILILDDYHIVQQSPSIDKWMTLLIQHIPANLHIVISSRTRPTWESLTPMKVKNELLEIRQKDLMFSFDEVEVLLRDYYECEVDDAEIELIFSATEGWVIAIGMIWQQLTVNGNLNEVFVNKAQSLDDLFKFLAMEVFQKQPPMVQQFLESTCIFEELTGQLCDDVLGMSGSSAMLENISNKNLFLYSIGDGQYRYHALFKEFLEKQLRTLNDRQYKLLHERSGNYYVRSGLMVQAIYHFEAINDFENVARILDRHGQVMIEHGQLESLLERLKKIPDALKNQYYLLWLYEGEVLRYRCSYNEAERCYLKAIEKASQVKDYIGESRALEGQARIYLDTIQPGKAERFLQNAIEVLENSGNIGNDGLGRLYHLMSENLANAGQAIKAQKWFEKGRELNIPLEDGNLEARLYLRSGKLMNAKKILIQKKITESSNVQVHLQQSHRETDLLLSLIEAFMGNGDEAKALAQAGIQQGVRFQAPFVEACGWIRLGHAEQLLGKYDYTLVKQCYETALEIMDEINVSRGKAEPLMGLCILFGNEGAYDRSIEYGTKALEETEKVKDAWLSALILLCMAIAAVHNDKFEEANDYLSKCTLLFTECGDQYGALIVALWRCVSSFYGEEENQFATNVQHFIKLLQLGDYDFIFKKRTLFGPRDLKKLAPILLDAQRIGVHRQYISNLLDELGITNVTNHPGYTLRIQTLGKFRVWLGTNEVHESDWQRGKAKELLEFFVTRRNVLIPKEELFSMLWSGLDEKAASRDFKVALNALNNALEPNRKARSTPFFIQRVGSSYGLNPDSGYLLDIDEFESWIQAGLEEKESHKVIKCLQRGLELYEGDYLPERRYDDWCLNERERLQVNFLRGAERMAQAYVQAGEYEKTIYWCEKIIEKDKTWEEAYRLLMFAYYHKNNRPQGLKWYKKCCEALEDELGVEPMTPTKQMYDMLLSAKTS